MISDTLSAYKSRFYHAINLRDFQTYWERQSILSRNTLTEYTNDYTRFFSDEKDRELGVWNRTFGNLNDFGVYFSKFSSAIPNAYGPITFVFNENIWNSLEDLQVTKNTITSENPAPIDENEIQDCFEERKGRFYLKSGFTACEVSSSLEAVNFENLAFIIVEPIVYNGVSLRNFIKSKINAWTPEEPTFHLSERRLIERVLSPQNRLLLDQLVEWSSQLRGRLIDHNESLSTSLPNALIDWFGELQGWKKHVLASWLTYTFNGTLRWMQ